MRLYLLRTGTIRAIGAPVPAYLLVDGDSATLVDTGYPIDLGADPDGFVTVSPAENLLTQLDRLDLRPADVHRVICTHLDPDHAGNHDRFPDAEFVVQRRHLDAARSGEVDRIELIRDRWDVPGLRYRLVDGDVELSPCLRLVSSDGHVPGHQSVLVRLPNTGPVLLAGDAVPMSGCADAERRPITPFDVDAAAVRRSTARLAAIAAETGALVVYGHDAAQWATLRTFPNCYD
ncbi:N-acyl homoserine lactonase family protein [Micromonospora sp. CPCC 205371]|nr:N-acyl homoserine lactonase family protein [Micromonospora sp. CPCC 205371]